MEVKKSSKPKGASSEQGKQKSDPDPVPYQEVDMDNLPSQYTEDIETLGRFLTSGTVCLGPLTQSGL